MSKNEMPYKVGEEYETSDGYKVKCVGRLISGEWLFNNIRINDLFTTDEDGMAENGEVVYPTKNDHVEWFKIHEGLYVGQTISGIIKIRHVGYSFYSANSVDEATNIIGACIIAELVSAGKIDPKMDPEERCPNCGNRNRLCTC